MTDSIFRSTLAIPDLLAGRNPRSFGEQAESAMKQLWVGLFWGPTTIARVVVSVMIAQRWETRVQRGTQPVRLKTGCTNFRLGIEPSFCAFLTIIPPRNRQRFNPPANYHLCGLSWEGSSVTANHQGRFQIQARSSIMAREASRWRSAFRLWGLWDSGSP